MSNLARVEDTMQKIGSLLARWECMMAIGIFSASALISYISLRYGLGFKEIVVLEAVVLPCVVALVWCISALVEEWAKIGEGV